GKRARSTCPGDTEILRGSAVIRCERTSAGRFAIWRFLFRGPARPGKVWRDICEGFSMTIIDSQVHAYEANTPERPWHTVPNWPDHVTGDEMVAAMDRVGIDGAIFISAFSMYRYDASYAVEVRRAHRGRFGIVKPVDPDDPAVGDIIADWKQTPGAVGIRVIMTKEAKREPNDPGLDRILRAAVKHDLPVN